MLLLLQLCVDVVRARPSLVGSWDFSSPPRGQLREGAGDLLERQELERSSSFLSLRLIAGDNNRKDRY